MNKENILKYKIEKNCDKIKIFGDLFAKNNKSNCKIQYNNKEEELNEYFYIDKISKNESDSDLELAIKLIIYKDITNMSYMFCACNSLLPSSDLSKLNTSRVNDMSFLFYQCESLVSLPDISDWNTSM